MLLKSFIQVLKSRNSKVETNTEWCKVSIEISDPLRKTVNTQLFSLFGFFATTREGIGRKLTVKLKKIKWFAIASSIMSFQSFFLLHHNHIKVAEREKMLCTEQPKCEGV